jgi:hypothetical protein
VGDALPPTAAQALQNHVGQFRRALDTAGASGPRRGQADARGSKTASSTSTCFEPLVREGGEAPAQQRPAEAAACLREALALWRGPPLADAVFEPFAQGEIARLEERRIAARALRIDADLTLSRYTDVMGELEALGARRPRHERLRAQLIARLDRCGRQPRSPTSARRVLLAGVRTLSTAPRLADHITGARSRVRSRARAARPAIPYG